MGSVYQRGSTWWIKYYQDGKPHRESSHSKRKRDAERLLRKREGSIATGTFTGIAPERTTFSDLANDLLTDYEVNRKKNLRMVRIYVRRLEAFFGRFRGQNITTDTVRKYISRRQAEISIRSKRPPAAATINRELSALRRMFNLGKQAGKVVVVPYIPLLIEKNVREGFFHHRDYLRLKEAVPGYLRPVVSLAYFSGMRQGEILSLRWEQVDFHQRLIRLEATKTKNNCARTVPISEELAEELADQRRLRDRKFLGCPYVFFNHATGARIQSFRKAWSTACKKIGIEGALFHDFRRTGVRNLVRAGVPENVAMTISGHKTRSVFDRYDIVDEEDVKAAGAAVERYLNKSMGTKRAQILEFAPSRRKTTSL